MVTNNPLSRSVSWSAARAEVLAGAWYDAPRRTATFCAVLQTIILVTDARDVAEQAMEVRGVATLGTGSACQDGGANGRHVQAPDDQHARRTGQGLAVCVGHRALHAARLTDKPRRWCIPEPAEAKQVADR
jgi:hypothetical protein